MLKNITLYFTSRYANLTLETTHIDDVIRILSKLYDIYGTYDVSYSVVEYYKDNTSKTIIDYAG